MRRSFGILAACAFALAAGSTPAGSTAAAEPERSHLERLLGLVPDTATAIGGRPIIGYADYEAAALAGYADMFRQAGIEPEFERLPAVDIMRAGMRLRAGPYSYQSNLYLLLEAMPQSLGIAVPEVRRGLEFGDLPQIGTILDLDPAGTFAAAIGDALLAQDGYAVRDLAGVPAWHRFEDGELNFDAVDQGNPFRGELGVATRIALLGTTLIGTAHWPVLNGMLDAAADRGPSLIDNPVFATTAAVLADSGDGGSLVQAVFINPLDTMSVPAPILETMLDGGTVEDLAQLVEPQPLDPPLAPYAMVALGDRYIGAGPDGPRDEAVIVLVYPDLAAAQAAATAVVERFAQFELPNAEPGTWAARLDALDGAITASAVRHDPLAAAVVRISYRAVYPTDDDTGIGRPIGGRLFHIIWDAYARLSLTPLLVLP